MLELGEANLNFLIAAGERKYVLQINVDPSAAAKSRIEYEILTMLRQTGIGAPRAYVLDESKELFGETLRIIEYLDGEALSIKESGEISQGSAKKLAGVVAKIHSLDIARERLPKRGASYKSWIAANRRNIEYLGRRRGRDDRFYELLQSGLFNLSRVADVASKRVKPFETPAHGDVCAQNVIVDNKTSELKLIYWENFGLWDPADEIALIFEGFGLDFPSSRRKDFFETYLSARRDETIFERLAAFTPLVKFEQLTWRVKHVLEIAGGEMDNAFVESTNLRRHLDYVLLWLDRCAEAGLINIKPSEAIELAGTLIAF
jgi:aminoglycoside phosphotransferase (APT) family kinase protein